MATKRILVPFDISEYSLDASNEAIELARLFGGSITFIHIVEPEPQYDIVYDLPQAEREVKDEITAKVMDGFHRSQRNVIARMSFIRWRCCLTGIPLQKQ
jgi:nucleotide-binding universal stress UspA family protein